MVKIKQDREQDREGDGNKHVPERDLPEINKPAPVSGRGERRIRRQLLELDGLHAAEVHEAREEDNRQRGTVVLQKHPHGVAEQGALAELAAGVGDHEDEQGDHDGQVEGGVVAEALEHLDALLQVDEGDVEAEDVAGEPRHVPQPVARVGDGQDPVEDERPQADPAHEGQVVGSGGHHDVVNRAEKAHG